MNIRPKQPLLNPNLKRPSALQSQPRNPRLLWLDKNENIDAELNQVTQKVLDSLSANTLFSYPEAGELYRKLSIWNGISPESFLLTPGSDGVIRLVFEAFVGEGDKVVHTLPTFAMYPVYSQVFGAEVKLVEYESREGSPFLDTDKMISLILSEKPKLVCLPNPDSPTGTVVSPEVLQDILKACESVGSVLLIDEAYHPFYKWSAIDFTKSSTNIIVARTFAKAWGVAGLRIGYAVAHPNTISLLHKMRPMYETSTLGIEFMSKMMDEKEEMIKSVERIIEGRTYFASEMRAIGFDVIMTEANFIHVRFNELAPAIHKELANKVLYRQSFDHRSLSDYSRFSVAPLPIMKQLVSWIKNVIK